MLTDKPTISPVKSIGAASSIAVFMASKKNPVIKSGVIALFSLRRKLGP